jgi:hypothetical protein
LRTRKFPSAGRLAAASLAMALALPSVLRAEDFCGDIAYLIEQSRAGFAGISSGVEKGGMTLLDASECAVSTSSIPKSYSCTWAFDFRAGATYETYEEIRARLDGCIGEASTTRDDRGVNHPDFYAARHYLLKQTDISVSIKDKGELRKTFVFLRVRAADPG